MSRILVGLLLITLVAGFKDCTPGTQVDAGDGCNTCLCLGKGTVVSCTLRDCSVLRKKREVPLGNLNLLL
uniref:Putative secreted protein n=1 Tax=Panstrongylus lignarius TaxID=156445 RepID=A0A224Y4Y7_9HEMI